MRSPSDWEDQTGKALSILEIGAPHCTGLCCMFLLNAAFYPVLLLAEGCDIFESKFKAREKVFWRQRLEFVQVLPCLF